MVSIQSMILIPDPMYNEPGYEGMRDTQEGEARSREYNARAEINDHQTRYVRPTKKPHP